MARTGFSSPRWLEPAISAAGADAGGRTGLAAGDAICQARARAAGLGGNFVAWLSDTNDDAYCRIQGLSGKRADNCGQAALPAEGGPWMRTDGFPFSSELAQFIDQNIIYSPIRFDEFGAEIPDSPSSGVFFTATGRAGIYDGIRPTCSDWTNAASEFTDAGYIHGTAEAFTRSFGVGCDSNHPLACFQTGAGEALPTFETPGNIVFVSSVGTDGAQGGVAGGDAFCQTLADAAGIPGNFKVWLSDSTVDAIDRLNSDGPWVRIDGVKLADDKADLVDGFLFTAISVDETGTYPIEGLAFTATSENGTALASHCQNWTSNDPADTAIRGSVKLADDGWTTSPVSFGCDRELRRFCFED